MAKAAEASMNVSALKLADPYVKEIIDTAGHVAFYKFNSERQEWEKTNIEGALFIYSRTKSGEPKYNAFVLNRLSTLNLIEPVNEALEIQLQVPFLLYRNSGGNIHSIWFYDKEECNRLAATLDKLVKEVTNPKLVNLENNVDGSRRVMDFFAKAGNKVPNFGERFERKSPKPEVNNPILQKLFANPVHVQDLEKQHKKDEMPYFQCDVDPEPLSVSELEKSVAALKTSNTPKPALLPPGMFAPTPATSTSIQPEPLTKTQLIQAVSYLLQNDSDFVTKLHEAYVKSFVDMVS